MPETGDGTRCVQGGAGPEHPVRPVIPGPVLSATFHLGLPDDPLPTDFYGRAGNPTWRALETAIGDLDGGECVVFASGMAAVAAVLRLRAGPGRAALRRLLRDPRARRGEDRGRRARGAHRRTVARRSQARASCCWRPPPTRASTSATSPRSPPPRTPRARSWPSTTPPPPRSASARWRSAPTSPLASDTKALAGHDDVVLGHVSTARPRAGRPAARAAHARQAPGPARWRPGSPTAGSPRSTCASPGRPPTPPRVVEVLRGHPAVAAWRWPGHPDDPAHDLARRQMRRWNGVIGLTLASEAAVGRFLAASRLVASATSFGGVRTSADRRQRWGDAVPPGLLRLSVGCEDARRSRGRRAGRADGAETRRRISHSPNPPGLWSDSRREVVA